MLLLPRDDQADRPLPRRLEVHCRLYEDAIYQKHRFAPSSNPVVLLVKEISAKILAATGHQAPLNARVLGDGALKNAFALPNGTICLCPSLLSYLDSEDEIAALIAHEYIHVLRRHSVKALEHTFPGAAPLDALKESIGLGRIAETEADVIGAVAVLAKIGYNPTAMIRLLTSIERISQGWDPIHGSALGRRLNVGTLIPHVHLEGSETPLTPVNEDLRGAIAALLTSKEHSSKPTSPSTKARQVPERAPLAILRSRLERAPSPRDLERGAKLVRQIARLVDKSLQEVAEASIRRERLDISAFERKYEHAAPLLRRVAALSNILAGFDFYLASSARNAGLDLHADAGRFLLTQWLGAEAGIDYFAEMPGSNRCRLDLSRLRLGAAGDDPMLYDICYTSVADNIHETDRLSPIADSYNPILIDLLPSLYAVARVRDPVSVLVWAHRETSAFLDDAGERIDATKMLATSGPCLLHYRASVEHTGSMRQPFVTAELASDILKQVVECEGALDDDPTASVVADGDLAEQVAFLYRLKTVDNRTLWGTTSQALWDGAHVIPADQRIGTLVEIWRRAHTEGEARSLVSRFEEYVRERGFEIVRDLRNHVEGAPPEEREAILISSIAMFASLDIDSHPNIYEISQRIFLLAAELTPPSKRHTSDKEKRNLKDKSEQERRLPDRTPGVLWQGSRVALAQGFNDYFFTPARSGLEEAQLLQSLCGRRFGGDIEMMVRACADDAGESLLKTYFGGMIDDVSQQESVEGRFERLTRYCNTFPLTRIHLATKDLGETLVEQAEELFESLAPHATSATRLLALCSLMSDPDLRGRLIQYSAELAAEGADFNELKSLVLEDPFERIPIVSKASECLTEELANSGEHLDDVSSGLTRRALNLSARRMGEHAVLEGLLHQNLKDTEELLLAGLETVHDESRLACYLVRCWWEREAQFMQRAVASVVHFDRDEIIAEWLDDSLLEMKDGVQSVDPPKELKITALLDQLYVATEATKALFVRKLLTGEHGILHDRAKANRVLRAFLDRYVDLPDAYKETANEVCAALVEMGTIDELYFRIASFLTRALFQRPPQRADGGAIIWDLNIPELAALDVSPSHMDERDYVHLAYLKTYNLVWGRKTLDGKSSEEPTSRRSAGAQVLWDRLPTHYKESSRFEPLDAPSAIHLALQAEGQIGARAAQVIPQYWELPPEIASAFDGVYDDQHGQAKTAAYRLIRGLAPELVRPADLLERRLGGGSLATVYRLKRAFEGDRVVKVLNPNAELRVRETTSLWSRVLTRLVETTGKEGYRFFRDQLIQDTADWLISDIRDERFTELDARFFERWNGYKLRNARIVVPRSETVESIVGAEGCREPLKANRYIKVDQMIEGENLTRLSLGKFTDIQGGFISAQDYSDVMSLLVTNYAEQLLTGVAHSNPHPGNYRVLFERGLKGEIQVAILDRNFYLEYPEEERARIKGLVLHARQPTQLARAVVGAIIATPENRDIDPKVADEVLDGIEFKGLKSVDALARRLKELGIKVPLRYTLLLVNINAFDQMCREAGLDGIANAFDKPRLVKATLLPKRL